MEGNKKLVEAYNAFNANNHGYNVGYLLPSLVAQGIISPGDKANIQLQNTLEEAATMLFLGVMTTKSDQQKRQFLDFVGKKNILELVASEPFQDFLLYLNNQFPYFDVRYFLPQLVGQLILTRSDQTIIKNCPTPAEATNVLFLDVLPYKDPELITRFIDFLRKNYTPELANYLSPMITEFYSKKAKPAKEEAAASAEKRGTAKGSSPQDHLPVSKPVQPVKPVHPIAPVEKQPVDEEFLSANSIQTSHTIEAYDKEYKALAKSQNRNVPDTAGHLEIHVQDLEGDPSDMPNDMHPDPDNIISNPYYSKKGNRFALVINNNEFRDPRINRRGSVVDFYNINNLLTKLGYDVLKKENRTAREMLDDVLEFVAKIENQGPTIIHSCVVVVMTHGELGWFMGVDEMVLNQQKFFKVVTENTMLAGIPKIFIVQACRGSRINLGMLARDGIEADMAQEIAAEEADAAITKIATGSDTCILYSTTPGYYCWRNTTTGSWFIQAICEEFGAHAHRSWADLLTLATRVTAKLASRFFYVGQRHIVQLPATEVNMRKKFHFFPGHHRE